MAPTPHPEILPHLFRLEYTKMTAVLCRHFGLQHIETAEDIASETFLKAMEVWGSTGIPENPAAWLYTVAKNKTKDHLKRLSVFEKRVKDAITPAERAAEQTAFDFNQQAITDSQLAMIFAVCNPANSPEAQICLALQVLCGFSVEEIANAFLAKTETIKKRLLRARANLRNDDFRIAGLDEVAIQARLDTVLRTIYLLFNEGYYSKSASHLIRKDLCSEALRLGLLLTENELTNVTAANALLALMCYQSSRFGAREDDMGNTILFEQQDPALWSSELTGKGNQYLVNACSGSHVTKYHLEAGIAYWHTTPPDGRKWEHILELYNQLLVMEYSPLAALNRTFAFAKVHGVERGIREAELLGLHETDDYHALLGYLYADIDPDKAIAHYTEAVRLSGSDAARRTLTREMERLAGRC